MPGGYIQSSCYPKYILLHTLILFVFRKIPALTSLCRNSPVLTNYVDRAIFSGDWNTTIISIILYITNVKSKPTIIKFCKPSTSASLERRSLHRVRRKFIHKSRPINMLNIQLLLIYLNFTYFCITDGNRRLRSRWHRKSKLFHKRTYTLWVE